MSGNSLDKSFAQQKLTAALRLVDKICAGDWPYEDSLRALQAIRGLYAAKLEGINSLDQGAARDIIAAWCSDARQTVSRYHTFIGFILRSSNVRNAFEIFAPLRMLANQLLGAEYQVVLGSEWSYTPFAYPNPMEGLEKFVFIGLPAAEANNSLLVPVAGHELGHALWRRENVNSNIKDRVKEDILRVFLNRPRTQGSLLPPETIEDLEKNMSMRRQWRPIYELAVRQCEEVFCDALGCWLFGEGFLHAYRYIMYPELGTRSAPDYPSNRSRADFLERAFSKFHGYSYPLPLKSLFQPQEGNLDADVAAADEATAKVVDTIIDEIEALCNRASISKPTKAGSTAALGSLRSLMPAVNLATVADVINAGWELRMDQDSWNVPGVNESKKISIVDELVFKSFEVNEWSLSR